MKKAASSIRKRLLALRPALLSDALGKSGGMDHDMQCFSANCRMAGPAYTLRVHTADILMVGKALSDCPPGRVLVIDGQGERNTALWGAITTECARLKRVEGIVIDGAIRDLAQIRRCPAIHNNPLCMVTTRRMLNSKAVHIGGSRTTAAASNRDAE